MLEASQWVISCVMMVNHSHIYICENLSDKAFSLATDYFKQCWKHGLGAFEVVDKKFHKFLFLKTPIALIRLDLSA